MLKLLQFSDCHLDSPFSSLPADKAAIRRAELRKTFVSTVKKAAELEVDAVLIPGDIFDGEYIDSITLAAVKSAFAENPRIFFFVAPGNHDALNSRSPYMTEDFGSNVYVFRQPSMAEIAVPSLGMTVYGCASIAGVSDRPPLRGFNAVGDGLKIGLLHGLLTGENGSDYAPVTKEDIAASGFDYLALGHVHSISGPNKCGNTIYAYAGCTEARGFDEPGEKYCLYIEYEGGSLRFKKIKTNCRTVHILPVDITGCLASEQAAERMRMAAQQIPQEDIVRFLLTGELSEDADIDCNTAAALAAGFFYSEAKDKTSKKLPFERFADSSTLAGIALQKFSEMISKAENEEQRELFENAARLCYKAITGERVNCDD